MPVKKMSQEDKQDWDELYRFVKKLLNYDNNQALSKTMILRLKGLSSNKFIENKNIKDTANYSYKVILNTFKFCSSDIQRAFNTKQFKDENHKFLYMTKIVENNLNNVYIRMRNLNKAKEESKKTSVKTYTHSCAKYQPKEKKKDKFKDLW